MSDIKIKYPATSSVALTIGLASLADDNTNKIAGRESTAVDNTTNLDLDHLLSGLITVGTSPTADRQIEIWAYAARSISAGTPTYPDVLDGTDSAETMTSRNVLLSALRLVASITVDSTSNRGYDFAPVSIAQLFGGALPPFWGLFVVNCTGVALHATAGNHVIHYERIQGQTV
jgi:hypothetical protein